MKVCINTYPAVCTAYSTMSTLIGLVGWLAGVFKLIVDPTGPDNANVDVEQLQEPGDENSELENEKILKRASLLKLQRRLIRAKVLRDQIPELEKRLHILQREATDLGVDGCSKRKGAVKRKIKDNTKTLHDCKMELKLITRRTHYLSPAELVEQETNSPLKCEQEPAKPFEYALVNEAQEEVEEIVNYVDAGIEGEEGLEEGDVGDEEEDNGLIDEETEE
jgi:hypothetical protein